MRIHIKDTPLAVTGRLDRRCLPPDHPDRQGELDALFDAVERFFKGRDIDDPTYPDGSILPIWTAYRECAK